MSNFGGAMAPLSMKLTKASIKKFSNVFSGFDWVDSLEPDALCFSPELVTLYPTPLYSSLPKEGQVRLAFWECINFFSLNIHGEKSLLAGLASRLYKPWPNAISEYIHHFIDEENKHMSIFGGFCVRYAGKTYPDNKINFPSQFSEGEEDFLFFAKVLIFEEFVDYFNQTMARDERLHPLIREINRYHHQDEARHLAFGREVVKDLYQQHVDEWGADRCHQLSEYLVNYMQSTWKEYYNPRVYADAGLENSYKVYQMAFNDPKAVEFRKETSARVLTFLIENKIVLTGVNR